MVEYVTGAAYQRQQNAADLANILSALAAQSARTNATGQGLAGDALSAQAPQQPPAGAAPAPQPAQGAPQPVPMPNAAPMPQQNNPMPVPMRGDAPMPAIPQMPAAALQRPAAPPAPPAPAQGGAPAQAAQSAAPPWWKTMAAQIKQQNPDANGKEVMAALNSMAPLMNQQNKQDFDNFKLQMQNNQKENALSERERNDTARANAYQENADSNSKKADAYAQGITQRNERALQDIKIKLDAAKARSKNANNDPAYRALETQYKQVSQDIRSAQALGAQTTPDQLLELHSQLAQLTSKMDQYQTGSAAPEASDALPTVAGSPPAEQTVNVINAEGIAGTIPASQLNDALANGYKKAP